MTPRERWVVYPLLFFALSLALKPKLLQEIDTKRLRCESLTIARGDQECILLRGQSLGGAIQVLGEKEQPAAVITTDGKAGIIQTYAQGRPQITLNTMPNGTFVGLHQVPVRSGVIYGTDQRGQLVPLAAVEPNVGPPISEDLIPSLQIKPAPNPR